MNILIIFVFVTILTVEVFVNTASGDILKAVSDGSGDSDKSFQGIFKGAEVASNFTYTAAKTAIVSNYTLSYVDFATTRVEIFGNYFAMSNDFDDVSVVIANHPCNITDIKSTFIECLVTSVPWGSYQPTVHIKNFGDALISTNKTLNFKQSVYDIQPKTGSFAGGQILTITGMYL